MSPRVGCCLSRFSPYLSMIILELVLRLCRYHRFADDLPIYSRLRHGDMRLSVEKINTDIDSIAQWSALNRLMLNLAKTQAILLSSRDHGVVPRVNVCNTDISCSEHVRDLGMVINCRLTWGDHVGLICKRVSLYSFRRMANATPVWLRRRLVLVLLLLHFLNGEVVYYGHDRVFSPQITGGF